MHKYGTENKTEQEQKNKELHDGLDRMVEERKEDIGDLNKAQKKQDYRLDELETNGN